MSTSFKEVMKSRTKKQNRQTIGTLYNDIVIKSQEGYDSIEDMEKAMADPIRLEEKLWNLVDAYKRKYPNKDGFIQLMTLKDRLMPKVIKRVWAARFSCPDPWFDETVWMYHHKDDSLEYLWTLPDPETSKLYLKNENNICPEEQWLLKHCQDCRDGKLDALAKKLNGEKKDSVHILLNDVPENLIVQ